MLLAFANAGQASDAEKMTIYLFGAKDAHCLVEKQFLEDLQQRDNNINLLYLELTESKKTGEDSIKLEWGAEVAGVPFTVVGNLYVVGWHDEQTTGLALKKAVQKVRQDNLPDIVAALLPSPSLSPPPQEKRAIPDKIKLPIFGEIELKYLSLGLLTVIFGALDGFNPCAMWVLVFLISLLLGMEDRKKMWILGSLFIFSSGFVYFLFMTAWLNLFIFIGLILWVRIIIGLVALGAGIYNLKEFFTNKFGACKLTVGERRQRTLERIKALVRNQSFWLAVGGIVCLAFAVNLVEFLCYFRFARHLYRNLNVKCLAFLGILSLPVFVYLYIYTGRYPGLWGGDDYLTTCGRHDKI